MEIRLVEVLHFNSLETSDLGCSIQYHIIFLMEHEVEISMHPEDTEKAFTILGFGYTL